MRFTEALLFKLALPVPLLLGCDAQESATPFTPLGPDPLPAESFENPPEQPIEPGSLVIKLENLRHWPI